MWWVKWVDHEAGGKVVRESTGLRCDRVQKDLRARRVVDKFNKQESVAKVRIEKFGRASVGVEFEFRQN